MKNIDITYIQLSAKPGTTIGDCFQEALVLASTEWRNVRLMHNGKMYHIQPNDLIGAVKDMGEIQEERKGKFISMDKYRGDIVKLANESHEAISYVGQANYVERETEAHGRIIRMEKELLP
jgi:hypothetical protein